MSDKEDREHFRDVLVEVHTMLKTHLTDYEKHKENDKQDFNKVYSMIGELRKYLYMGLGAIAAFEVAIKFFKD